MTKNQKTYALLAVVLAVWGILGFKVVNGLGPKEPVAQEVRLDTPFVVQTMEKREPIVIAANYRDPFLGTPPKSQEPKKKVKKKPVKPKPPKKNIAYSGSVAQNGTKNRMFFVTIDGQQHLMQKNQKVNEVTLVKGNQKSITVKYPGHTETIVLNP
ncbi:MAG: hypothetical protein AAF039_16515 [Bacteroidota bacterium]